jgi:hypothetical protein
MMISVKHIMFQDVPLNTNFKFQGNTWNKASTRTARIIDPSRFNHRVFYFGKSEYIYIEVGS